MESDNPAAMLKQYVAQIASLKLALAKARGQGRPLAGPLAHDGTPVATVSLAGSESSLVEPSLSRADSSTFSFRSLDLVDVEVSILYIYIYIYIYRERERYIDR